MGTYYVTKESQEIAGCRLIRYGIGCRWREILGLSHNRQAVEWLVERCNTLEYKEFYSQSFYRILSTSLS